MSVRPFAAAALSVLTIASAGLLAGCQDSGMLGGVSARSLAPVPQKTVQLMAAKGMSQSDPILVRAYKKEAEMEVWKRTSSGQYALLKTFPICRWSGQLGPKTKQGDRQAPEGFYTITPGQMNPNSSYYLSFDVGYPNAIDRAKGGTGNYIMVHGTCSSSGCFAMTDASMAELYAIARDSFAGGQRAFQFQSYPFRMTAQNMARFRNDPNMPFWKNLKEGSDHFEALKEEPRVAACGTRYVFGGADVAAGSCTPKVEPLVAEKRARDATETAELIAKGERATRVVYEDGGQNPVFRPQPPKPAFAALTADKEKDKEFAYTADEYGRHSLGDVSRPETLAAVPQEFEIDAKGRPVLVASADAPGPTKAAAAALEKKKGAKPASVVAKVEPAAMEPATTASTPARVTVADADGDPAAYRKVLGDLFGGSKPATPPTPAVDAVVAAEPAKAPAAAKSLSRIAADRSTAKPASGQTGTKATAKVEAKPAAKSEPKADTRPEASKASSQKSTVKPQAAVHQASATARN